MRKILVSVLAAFLLVMWVGLGVARAAVQEPSVEARSAILLHPESGQILYAKDAHRRMYPASTTKVMTALLTLEHGRLNDVVRVGPEVDFTPADGSLIGIKSGDRISVRDLLHGLILCSGNDAAYALGVYVARRVSSNTKLDEGQAITHFVKLMNRRALVIGAKDTNFANPDGYHDPSHWTTAYDLALIATEAMQNKVMRKITATMSYEPTSWQRAGEQTEWKSGNRLFDTTKEYYVEGVTGLKPGYTPESGFCQVTTATRQGFNVISVVLKSSSKGRWLDSRTLLEYGFASFECVQVASRGQPVTTVSIGRPLVSSAEVVADKDVFVAVKRGQGTRLHRELEWSESEVYQSEQSLRLQLPARRTIVVGKAVFLLDDRQLAEVDLVIGELQAGWLRYVLVGGTWMLLAGVLVVWASRR